MDLFWIVNIVAVFLLCVISAGVLIPQILLIAYRKNLFDIPNERKIHTSAVPRLGGIAFLLVVLFSFALALAVSLNFGHKGFLELVLMDMDTLAFAFCAALLLYIVGIADDLIGVQYRAKFIIQILCSAMLIAGGLWIGDFKGILWLHEIPWWTGYPLTVLVIVFIINAINLIDGIDGLASGLCSVAFVTYGVTFIIMEEYIYATLAFANLGVLLPFYYYNVFGDAKKHKKIFMGDTGSLTIGMAICFLSLRMLNYEPIDTGMSPNMFVVAFAPVIIPCFDVIRVYFHRVRNGINPFLPDKNHIHHKFLAVGMPPRAAMATIISISCALIIINCLASIYVNVNILLVADALFVTGGNIWLSKRIKERGEIH